MVAEHQNGNAPSTAVRAVVVERWALLREGIVDVLTNEGLEVVGQEAGVEGALEVLRSTEPDLLVLGSPADESPLVLLRRAEAARPDVSVVVLVAPGLTDVVLRPAASPGGHALLRSTTSPGELARVVHQVVATRRTLMATEAARQARLASARSLALVGGEPLAPDRCERQSPPRRRAS